MESEDVNKIVEDILELWKILNLWNTSVYKTGKMAFIAKELCSSLVDSGWFVYEIYCNCIFYKFEQDYQEVLSWEK